VCASVAIYLSSSSTVPSTYASELVKEGSWDLVLGHRVWKGRNFEGGIDHALSPEEMGALSADAVDGDKHAAACPQVNIFVNE